MRLNQVLKYNPLSIDEINFLDFCESLSKINLSHKIYETSSLKLKDFDHPALNKNLKNSTNIFHFLVKEQQFSLMLPVIDLFSKKYGIEKTCDYLVTQQYNSTNNMPLVDFLTTHESPDGLLDLGDFLSEHMPVKNFYDNVYRFGKSQGQDVEDEDAKNKNSTDLLTCLSEGLGHILINKTRFNDLQEKAAYDIIEVLTYKDINWEHLFIHKSNKEDMSKEVLAVWDLGRKIAEYKNINSVIDLSKNKVINKRVKL